MGAGLAIVLLGGLIGVAIVVATLAMVVYGITTRDAKRGVIASAISLGLAVVAMLLSTPFWIIVVTRRGSHGESIELFGSDFMILLPVLLESIAFVAALTGLVRQLRRRGLPPPS